MIAAPALWRPSLWLPEKFTPTWLDTLAAFTAGKRQRNSSGKAQRNSDGKEVHNSASNSTCCCGCYDYTFFGSHVIDSITFSGVTISTACNVLVAGVSSDKIRYSDLNNTWSSVSHSDDGAEARFGVGGTFAVDSHPAPGFLNTYSNGTCAAPPLSGPLPFYIWVKFDKLPGTYSANNLWCVSGHTRYADWEVHVSTNSAGGQVNNQDVIFYASGFGCMPATVTNQLPTPGQACWSTYSPAPVLWGSGGTMTFTTT